MDQLKSTSATTRDFSRASAGLPASRVQDRAPPSASSVMIPTFDQAGADQREIWERSILFWDVADYDACEGASMPSWTAIEPIDVLVNNADATRDGVLHKMTPDQWRAIIDDDLSSCFNMGRQVIGPMRERGFGRNINISSINDEKGQVGQSNYAAAKAGIIGFTKAPALESAAKGVTVNAIAPGDALPGERRRRVHHRVHALDQWRPESRMTVTPSLHALPREAIS